MHMRGERVSWWRAPFYLYTCLPRKPKNTPFPFALHIWYHDTQPEEKKGRRWDGTGEKADALQEEQRKLLKQERVLESYPWSYLVFLAQRISGNYYTSTNVQAQQTYSNVQCALFPHANLSTCSEPNQAIWVSPVTEAVSLDPLLELIPTELLFCVTNWTLVFHIFTTIQEEVRHMFSCVHCQSEKYGHYHHSQSKTKVRLSCVSQINQYTHEAYDSLAVQTSIQI